MHPTPSRLDRSGENWKYLTTHRAARMEMQNMMGASASSAVLTPNRGTTQRVRMVPSTNPAANTRAK